MTVLSLLSDGAIVAVCVAAAAGCFALNRRMRRLASSEQGIGKAVSEMSRAVAQFEALLAAAEDSTREASAILDEQLAQARKLVARLEAIARAASPATSSKPEPSGRTAMPKDPLSDVVPKGVSLGRAVGQRSDGGEPAPPNSTAQERLANLALQRRSPSSDSANGLGRSARA